MSRLLAALAVASFAGAACAPRPLVFPTGPGIPRSDFSVLFDEATTGCRRVRSITAELSLSGRVAGQRVRGTVQAGLIAPTHVYLLAPAPFGQPGFILSARGERGMLFLPRERAVVADAPVRDMLDALAGLRLGPANLRALLTGCVIPDPQPWSGREYPRGWVAIALQGGAVAWLRQQDGRWRVAAAEDAGLTIEYGEYATAADATPRELRVRSASATTADVTLRIVLSQVELNVPLDPQTFEINVPPGTRQISVDELRTRAPLSQ